MSSSTQSLATPKIAPATLAQQLDLIAAGPWHVGEFAAIRQAVDPQSVWPMAPSLNAAIEQIVQRESPPELVLLAQLRPSFDEQADIELLREAAPLTRVIVIAGSWCEGELRTGKPLTGVVRIYWYEFPAWWRAALDGVARRESPPWAEPLDEVRAGQASRYPRIMKAITAGRENATRIVAIDAADYALFESLAAALASGGWTCVWQPRHRPRAADITPAAGIWDGAQLDANEAESLRRFCDRLSHDKAPVVALLDFPRIEHLEIARRVGAADLMAKPYQLTHLDNELMRLTKQKTTADRADFAEEELNGIKKEEH
jgi:hypothetical protein